MKRCYSVIALFIGTTLHAASLPSIESQLIVPILPIVGIPNPKESQPLNKTHLNLNDAILLAVQRHPSITQAVAQISQQQANIRAAQAGYLPALTGTIQVGDLTSSQRGRQIYSLKASQLLYDFGKVKTNVDIQQAKTILEQANALISVDDIAQTTSRTVLAIQHYQHLVDIAQEQLNGMQHLYEIAELRANAGISSRADPVQAQSYVDYAKSYLITQQSNLRQNQQRLNVLLGFDVSHTQFEVSDRLLEHSGFYDDVPLNEVPKLVSAKAEMDVATAQKQQAKTGVYPTIALTGTFNQAVNGRNPNTVEKNGHDTAVYLTLNTNLYQGGAIKAQTQAADFAEQAAQAKLSANYLELIETTRNAHEVIDHTQQQIWVLVDKQKVTAKTRELYEDQYKLGHRTILDLLSAEQSYHSARAEKEQALYSIYDTLAQYIATTGKTRSVYDLNNKNIQGLNP